MVGCLLSRPKPLFSIRLAYFQHYGLRYYGTKSGYRFHANGRYEKKNKCSPLEDTKVPIFLHKSRGQHILTNPRVLDSIIQKTQIKSTDTVLEIGPGTGNLTLKLLEAADKVIAVEIDPRMIEILSKRVSERGFEDKINVICKDALKADFPRFDLCVANIPYGISSPLIAKLFFGGYQFRGSTLLLQKEFAQRILAKPGDSSFNRLAANVKLLADVEFIMDVSKKDFVPCPKVDSSVIKIWPKTQIPDVDLKEWWAFTRVCFSKKNKTLGAIFKQKKKVAELLRRCNSLGVNNCSDNSDDAEAEEKDEDEDDTEYGEEFLLELSSFKEKIVGILRYGEFEEKRSSKLSNSELLRLLSLFNSAGIFFHEKKDRELGFEISANTSSM